MQTKKAVRVFPDPVGADMRVGLPARMLGHPSICGSVGEPNLRVNHSAVIGWAHDSSDQICIADSNVFAVYLPDVLEMTWIGVFRER